MHEHRTTELSNRVIASLTSTWKIVEDLSLRVRSTDFTSMNIREKQSTERPLAFGNSGYYAMNNLNHTILWVICLLTYYKN